VKKGMRTDSVTSAGELLRELALLRGRVDEATEQFSLGVKGRIDEILHILGRGEQSGAGHVLPEPRFVEKTLRRLKLLSNREPKGRAKDLKRIQDLVTALSEAVVSGK
jgi:hypothetical protein